MSETKPPVEGHVAPIGPLTSGQRWSLARKREVALCLLRGEPIDALSREPPLRRSLKRLARYRGLTGI